MVKNGDLPVNRRIIALLLAFAIILSVVATWKVLTNQIAPKKDGHVYVDPNLPHTGSQGAAVSLIVGEPPEEKAEEAEEKNK